ncbi:cryptochrome/photolyase family protein [Marinospirillum perlucidum]|uniref:cryptochrome/photolyase family protein n=1 Tax=Marinospirillum perlucidum TaxID=1982602 RepID=UPI000DF215C8|nr:cryptochrome/photolyase family protein [Marinospirillum perlucidum]
MAKTLRLILGDQLNARHSWFSHVDDQVVYLLAELKQEASYTRHHLQKLLVFFKAMQVFAQGLQAQGHRVEWLTLDATADYEDLPALIKAKAAEYQVEVFEYQLPDEYRLDQQLEQLAAELPCRVKAVDSEHFLTSRSAWDEYPHSRMEYFYRQLRREYRVLVDDQGQPLGGQWNFDQENRQALPARQSLPEPLLFAQDISEQRDRIERHGIEYLGRMNNESLIWPVSREEALVLLEDFLQRLLPAFGRYQDALTQRGWSLYHSRLSFSLNCKLLHPLEVIRRAQEHWQQHQEQISLAQVEGFIRQILGWREFVRAVYWKHQPDYGRMNYLEAQGQLPDFFWNGQTEMACVRHAVEQSLEFAYAHHIQRLMVTGNFALLAGVHPNQVDAWYLGIYIDAVEWVEQPNTRGMSQFADGGLMASKPYIASGNYLNKMGDYCRGCRYQVKQKTGPDSCPFNSLYWHFLDRHQQRLASNPRLKFPYANWRKQSASDQRAVLDTAESFLGGLDTI